MIAGRKGRPALTWLHEVPTSMKRVIPLVACLLLLGLALYLLSGRSPERHSVTLFLMDTLVEIQAYGEREVVDPAIQCAVDEMRRIERAFGHQDSLVDRFNRTHRVENREFYGLVGRSLAIHRASLGTFAITLGPLLEAWGFSGNHAYRVPPPEVFADFKGRRSEDTLCLGPDGASVTGPAGLELDLGGIAKGYAVDRAIEALQRSGLSTALVNAGGDIRVCGERTFRIGIRHPRAEGTFVVLPLTGRAIATSGDYERFFEDEHTRYSHILDPATGWPAQGCMSATVIAKTCEEADAWATALFVGGPKLLGKELARAGLEWIHIDRNGMITASPGLAGRCPDHL